MTVQGLFTFFLSLMFFHQALSVKLTDDESNPLTESFVYKETQLILFAEKVTWSEANAICPSYSSKLAVIDTMDKAVFLAASLADSNIQHNDYWVGGRQIHGIWTWTAYDLNIPLHPGVDRFPPWARLAKRISKECLALSRHGHDEPLFVDLDCRLYKPFICETSVSTLPHKPVPSRWLRVDGSTYVLYHGRVSWQDAVSFCREQDSRLGVVKSLGVAQAISQAMTHTRPDLESVWLGASNEYGHWTWVSTGERLSSKKDPLSNYPPWRYNSTRKEQGCVLLDRHVCDHTVFLEVNCDRLRNFVCEHYKESTAVSWVPDEVQFEHDNRSMVLHVTKKNWQQASDTCMSRGTRLVTLHDMGTVSALMAAMTDHPNEVKHVWIGGEVNQGVWLWSAPWIPVPVHKGKKDSFPPWCETGVDPATPCLNLDRREHAKPVMYGLGCYNKQPFVCEVDCTDPGRIAQGKWACAPAQPPYSQSCSLECDPGTVGFGTRSMRCSKTGWSGLDDSVAFPKCLRTHLASKHLLKLLSMYEDYGFIFLIDDSGEKRDSAYVTALQFISGVVRNFPISDDRPAGVISLGTSPPVNLPYNQTNTCDFLKALTRMGKHRVHKKLLLEQGFKLARDQINHKQPGRKTIMVCITDGSSATDRKLVIKSLKKEGHVVLVVRINRNQFSQQMSLPTVAPDNRLNYVTLEDYKAFTDLALKFTGERRIDFKNCDAELMLPGLNLTDILISARLLPKISKNGEPKQIFKIIM